LPRCADWQQQQLLLHGSVSSSNRTSQVTQLANDDEPASELGWLVREQQVPRKERCQHDGHGLAQRFIHCRMRRDTFVRAPRS
jgi:hypothetical protein